jgi:hypothetical protein
LITSNSHLSFIYYAIEACTILAGRMVARIIHISHTTLTNPGKTYHTCIAPHFLSVFLFFFSLSIDLGRLVGSMPLRYQKKESLVHLSSIVADRVVVRGGHCYYRVLSSLLYVSHCTVSLYLSLVWSTFNRALFSLHDHDQSIHDLLVIATG